MGATTKETLPMPPLLRAGIGVALAAVMGIGTVLVAMPSTAVPIRDQHNASINVSNLELGAAAIVQQAIDGGALTEVPPTLATQPASALMTAVYATLTKARADDPSLKPVDTTALMGPVPYNLSHPLRPRPSHRRVDLTHTLRRFDHAVGVGLSRGLGLNRKHDHVMPARPQAADGVFVEPSLPALPDSPTVAMVAIRAAMTRLGDPYVWAAAGPDTFDCSGLVRWAYGKAGLRLLHYTGYQWQEGKLIPPRDVLPGDLILFYRDLSHIGIYLGAGWMLNAPFTGQYVNVVPVHRKVAGIVRP
jgi:cell wall-associated NlpC family hydrolase